MHTNEMMSFGRSIIKRFFFVLIPLLGVTYGYAQVIVSGISTLSGFCPNNGVVVNVPSFSFQENASTDFGLFYGARYSLLAPAGFEFNTTAGSIVSSPTSDLGTTSLKVYSNKVDVILPGTPQTIVPADNHEDFSQLYYFLNGYNNFQRTALIYTSLEIGTTPGIIKSLSFFVNSNSSSIDLPVKIYLANYSPSNFSGSVNYATELSGATNVFNGSIQTSEAVGGSWYTIVFNTPFSYLGAPYNLKILIETNNNKSNANEYYRYFRYHYTSFNQFASNQGITAPATMSSFSFRPNVVIGFTNQNNNSVDDFTVMGLKLVVKDGSSSGGIKSSGIVPMSGFPTGSYVSRISSVSSGRIFGFEDQYCINNIADTISVFPNGGTLSASPSFPNPLTSLPGGNYLFNPKVYSGAGNVTLNYTYPGINGCTKVFEQSVLKGKPTTLNFSSPSISLNAFAKGDNPSGIPLGGFITSGESGMNYFVGNVVSGNTVAGYKFNPDLSTTTLPGFEKVGYAFTSYVTGCSDTNYRTFTIYNPDAVFNFLSMAGAPPLEVEFGVGKFCINDYNLYSITLNTLAGIKTPEQFYLSTTFAGAFFPRSTSITASNVLNSVTGPDFGFGVSVVGSGFGNVNSFKFAPSLSTVTSFNLAWNFDLLTTGDGNASGPRDPAVYWSSGGGASQSITVYDKPKKPDLSFSRIIEYCFGGVANTQLDFDNIGSTDKYNWYFYPTSSSRTLIKTTTLSGLTVTALGINNSSSISGYQFGVTRVINGCESDTSSFSINIKIVPTTPGVVNLNSSLPKFCAGSTYQVTLVPDVTVSGYTYKWFKGTPPTSGQSSAISTQTIFVEAVSTTIGYYLTSEFNGCSSNEILSSTTGGNITISTIPITFNSLPGVATVNPNLQYCVGQVIPSISVVGFASQGLDFRWYSDAAGLIPITTVSNLVTDSTGTTVSTTGIYFTNSFDSYVSSAQPTTGSGVSFYVRTRYTASGCKSTLTSKVNVVIYENPPVPNVSATLGDTLNDRPFCFDPAITTFIGINVSSTYATPRYLWYNSSTVLGTSTTLTGYSSTSRQDIAFAEVLYVRQVANGCSSNYKKIVVLVDNPVPPPLINPPPTYYCTGTQLNDIVASTSVVSGQIKWYRNSTITLPGAFISDGTSINPQGTDVDINVPATKFFYANVINKYSCVSSLSGVTIEYRQTPVVPFTFDTAVCAGSYLGTVRAEADIAGNQSMEWYSGSSTITGVITTIAGSRIRGVINLSFLGSNINKDTTIILSVRQSVNNCPSSRKDFSLYVKDNPVRPTSVSYSRVCVGDQLPVLNVSSSYNNPLPKFNWYLNTTVTAISSANSINTGDFVVPSITGWVSVSNPPTTYSFLVTQTINYGTYGNFTFSGCTSFPYIDTLQVYPIPPDPTPYQPADYCSGNILSPLSVTGVTTSGFNWFGSSLAGANLIGNQPTLPVVNIVANTVSGVAVTNYFYVNQVFNNCKSNRAVVSIKINPLPFVDFTGLKNTYCTNEPNATLTGIPSGGEFLTTMPGFTFAGNAMFNPTIPSENFNPYSIAYQYTAPGTGCINSVIKIVKIYEKPIISFTESDTLGGYCAYPGSRIVLIPKPNKSGTASFEVFSLGTNTVVSAITNIKDFLPDKVLLPGMDNDSIIITYIHVVNETFCSDTVYKKKYVYAVPTGSFVIPGFCEGDTLNFVSTVNGVTLNTLKYTWKFGSGDISTGVGNNLLGSIKRAFSVGSYNASLSLETPFGCKYDFAKPFQIGPYPIANFDWSSICFGNTTLFKDRTLLSAGNLKSRYWDFGDTTTNGDILLTSDTSTTATYKYKFTGTYNVKLISKSDKDCIDSSIIKVNILPYKTITDSSPYFNNFNNSDGWFSEGINDTWKIGTPNKKYLNVSALGTSNTWYVDTMGVGNLSYGLNQTSMVNSPCFNISTLKKPMVSFKIKVDTREGVDGAVMQYSYDDGKSWRNLGNVNTGINWYNSSNMLGNPGYQKGQPVGWSDILHRKDGWYTARHILNDPEVIGKSNVRFRLAFASVNAPFSDTTVYEGVAFDDVWIGERSKKALVEQFYNVADNGASYNAVTNSIVYNGLKVAGNGAFFDDYITGLNNLIIDDSLNITAIKYHTSFPGDDPFNNQNPSDPSARVLFYGITKTPSTVLDGNLYNGLSVRNDTLLINRQMVDNRTLDVPEFLINISKSISSGTLQVNATFTANVNQTPDTVLIAHVAVIERVVNSVDIKQQKRFESVLKAMLPDAGGSTLKRTWNIGESTSLGFNWDMSSVADVNQIGVVAFIQNTISKRILQSEYIGPGASFTDGPGPLTIQEFQDSEIEVYPNPASEIINIKLKAVQASCSMMVLIDQMGKEVFRIERLKGMDDQYQINTSKLQNGMYLLRADFPGHGSLKKKIVIMH